LLIYLLPIHPVNLEHSGVRDSTVGGWWFFGQSQARPPASDRESVQVSGNALAVQPNHATPR